VQAFDEVDFATVQNYSALSLCWPTWGILE